MSTTTKPKDGLNQQQRAFVEAQIAGHSGTESARMAGYTGTDGVLAATASRLLKNVKVSRLINKHLEKKIMSPDEVIAELSDIAIAKWEEFFEYTTIEGENVRIKVKLTDKLRALELLGKRYKLFTDKLEVTHNHQSAIDHYQGAINFAVRFALAPGEKTHATALAMLAENAKGNPDLEAVVAELAEKMNVKQISA